MFSDDAEKTNGEMYSTEAQDIDQLSQRDQRALVLHLLYAMDAFDYQVSLESITENFGKEYNYDITPKKSVFVKAASIIAERDELDNEIKPLLDNWRFERIGCCTRLIVRMSLWELKHTDTAPSIVMNEAVELAKCFSEVDAHKFINGILDEWVKRNMPGTVIEPHPETDADEK